MLIRGIYKIHLNIDKENPDEVNMYENSVALGNNTSRILTDDYICPKILLQKAG